MFELSGFYCKYFSVIYRFLFLLLIGYLRNAEFESSIKEVEISLRLRNLSKTRWTARVESIRALWTSYQEVKDTLDKIKASSSFDKSTKEIAATLSLKMESADFIMSVIFMKNILSKTKLMTEALQSEELNIIDALTIIESTVHSLRKIIEDEDTMVAEIHAGKFVEKVGGDAVREFERTKHRRRRRPVRFDENADNEAELDITSFFKREFKEVLNVQVTQFSDNLARCLESIKPLASVLQPPLKDHR